MPLVHLLVNTSDPDLLNGTVINLQTRHQFKDSELNELLYVVIVIMFYAMALMVLIATQIRKQKGRVGHEIEYYDEHLERNRKLKRPLLQTKPTPRPPIGSVLTKISDEGDMETVT
ncbi:hypothetical protein KP79_PYT08775 [Mizuhopecten yessoensis]|uniref:Uncharacterized protein n=1 Tax=Mizuhopecten yessoensis TaxID=6573 RepID=A0A210QJ83_MIZYE|nr:hypothetical protein KP79_PYT08775 [Mizuhopecten yessoensis]